jgi:hypothetical protein
MTRVCHCGDKIHIVHIVHIIVKHHPIHFRQDFCGLLKFEFRLSNV